MKKQDIDNFNKSYGSYDLFLDLLGKMLILNPQKRWTAVRLLKHPFFNPDKVVIDNFGTKLTINIPNSKYRKEAAYYFKDNRVRNNEFGYPVRVSFHALRIFDKFLDYNIDNLPRKSDVEKYKSISLYLAMKLFISHSIMVSYESLFEVQVSKTMEELLGKMEFHVISDVLCGRIYEPTLLEISDNILSEKDKWDLYEYYISLKPQRNANLRELCQTFDKRRK